jgi:hypothetical protein
MTKVVQISRTIEVPRRADLAAGDRHHHDEAERLWCQWQEPMDAELASPIETPILLHNWPLHNTPPHPRNCCDNLSSTLRGAKLDAAKHHRGYACPRAT